MNTYDRNRKFQHKDENMLQVISRGPSSLFGFRSLVYPVLGSNVLHKNIYITRVLAKKQDLPSLPVPPLEKTLQKFLKSAKPFLSETELGCTMKRLEDFSCQGDKLQTLLKERASRMENWLEEWWLNVAYLGFRNTVVVYSSPSLVFPEQKFRCEEERLNYTAQLILANVDYKQKIDQDEIPLEKMGKEPLDMSQYKRVYGTCRIPGIKCDSLQFNPKSTYIIVVHNNHYFKLNLCTDNQELLSQKVLVQQMKKILQSSEEEACPVGILTTENRDHWGCSYQKLIKDPMNHRSIKTIQKSLFLVCLDQPYAPCGIDNLTTANLQCIHGGGSKYNAGNRWYDKTIQFCIGNSGLNGLTYEHSPSEGQPIAVLTDYLVEFIEQDRGKCIPDPKCGVTEPEHLTFNLNDEIIEAIDLAKKNIDDLVCDFDLSCFQFKDYGKDFIKKQKMSPDSYIQMAMQFAFYRMHKEPAAHYESASLRKFAGGRTETIRSCSEESVQFAKCMLDCNASDTEKLNAMRAAVQAHKNYTVEALHGQGVDRHLLGLKLVAQENRIKLPDLYNDPSFIRSVPVRLTSSQVATKCKGLMSYGPTSPDGYAVCYNPRDKDIFFGVSTFGTSAKSDTKEMVNSLQLSLHDMCELLNKVQTSKL